MKPTVVGPAKPGQFLIYVLHHPDSLYVYVGRSSTGLRAVIKRGENVS